MHALDIQLHQMSTALKTGDLHITDIGSIVPASLMLHDLEAMQPVRCSYMNNWGCEHLGTSAEEINRLGEAYYERYFIKEEIVAAAQGIGEYLASGDFDKQYNFFQRVKLHGREDYSWFYTVCKVVNHTMDALPKSNIVLLSSPVTEVEKLISQVAKTLNQDSYVRRKYHNFSQLTNREKEIIRMVANGKSTGEIAEQLFLSNHTVSTHRKNIIHKTDCKSFAELVKFAVAFDLI